MDKHMIVVTGATGQLGRLVIANLLKRVSANQIVAAARTPSKAADLTALGVQVREADYSKPATLATAFAGAESVLLISSPALPTEGLRISEHKAVIDAAKAAGAQLLAYTSVLRADTSTLLVGPEHLATERNVTSSGIPWVLLRHGSYLENHTASLGQRFRAAPSSALPTKVASLPPPARTMQKPRPQSSRPPGVSARSMSSAVMLRTPSPNSPRKSASSRAKRSSTTIFPSGPTRTFLSSPLRLFPDAR
jgi:uncharacterized protein YbjT (DUF2867 family)